MKMNRMIWRLKMHRARAMQNKFLRIAEKVGLIGTAAIAVVMVVAHELHFESVALAAWQLLLMGGFLALGGLGFALAGDPPTVQEYAEGESEEMPGIGKMFSGLIACAGGLAVCMVAVSRILH